MRHFNSRYAATEFTPEHENELDTLLGQHMGPSGTEQNFPKGSPERNRISELMKLKKDSFAEARQEREQKIVPFSVQTPVGTRVEPIMPNESHTPSYEDQPMIDSLSRLGRRPTVGEWAHITSGAFSPSTAIGHVLKGRVPDAGLSEEIHTRTVGTDSIGRSIPKSPWARIEKTYFPGTAFPKATRAKSAPTPPPASGTSDPFASTGTTPPPAGGTTPPSGGATPPPGLGRHLPPAGSPKPIGMGSRWRKRSDLISGKRVMVENPFDETVPLRDWGESKDTRVIRSVDTGEIKDDNERLAVRTVEHLGRVPTHNEWNHITRNSTTGLDDGFTKAIGEIRDNKHDQTIATGQKMVYGWNDIVEDHFPHYQVTSSNKMLINRPENFNRFEAIPKAGKHYIALKKFRGEEISDDDPMVKTLGLTRHPDTGEWQEDRTGGTLADQRLIGTTLGQYANRLMYGFKGDQGRHFEQSGVSTGRTRHPLLSLLRNTQTRIGTDGTGPTLGGADNDDPMRLIGEGKVYRKLALTAAMKKAVADPTADPEKLYSRAMKGVHNLIQGTAKTSTPRMNPDGTPRMRSDGTPYTDVSEWHDLDGGKPGYFSKVLGNVLGRVGQHARFLGSVIPGESPQEARAAHEHVTGGFRGHFCTCPYHATRLGGEGLDSVTDRSLHAELLNHSDPDVREVAKNYFGFHPCDMWARSSGGRDLIKHVLGMARRGKPAASTSSSLVTDVPSATPYGTGAGPR